MAHIKRTGSLYRPIPKFMDDERTPGMIQNPGPYIGVVKNNVDPTRAGRLQVFIEDFSGVSDEPSHWITVSYASPYMGAARRPNIEGKGSKENQFTKVDHMYGMWFTPPDIGNFVLVTFINGDMNRGYWFACVMPELSQYALPGNAGSEYLEKPKDPALAEALTTPPYPCVEFNDQHETINKNWTNFLRIRKPVHEIHTKRLLREGLEDDKVRGVVSSSSQRESPSQVFGISTPGRDGPDKDPDTQQIMTRMGGHAFVMDDGDVNGKDQMMRLRTSSGHQILMSDTDKSIYIANSEGTVWMEFTGDGKIMVFSENSINLRTKNDFNLHSDKDINIFARDHIKMFAGKSIKVESPLIEVKAHNELKEYGGKIEVKAGTTWHTHAGTVATIRSEVEILYSSGRIYLNSYQAPAVQEPANIPVNTFKETIPTKPAPIYKFKHISTLSSTIPLSGFVPTHEPYATCHAPGTSTNSVEFTPGPNNPSTPTRQSSGGAPVRTGSGGNLVTSDGTVVRSPDYENGEDPSAGPMSPRPTTPAAGSPATAGPDGAAAQGTSKRLATQAELDNQPKSTTGVGNLSAEEKDALKTQVAATESGGVYDKVGGDRGKYLGKYQMGAAALEDQGYIAPGSFAKYGNNAIDHPECWANKDGIRSSNDFLNNPTVQEKAMDGNLDRNYSTLMRTGAINSSSPKDDVAGKLAASHLVGAGGVTQWTRGTPKADAFGTTADKYYNNGRYAINTLAAPRSAGSTSNSQPTQVAAVQNGTVRS